MKVLTVRNVHSALPYALRVLEDSGIRRDSRNGPVLQAPWPVTTVYEKPCERVLFWPQRDANPFFHLYESLWMLAGRNDVAPLERYVKKSIEYSDDGKTLYGAYGHRWRHPRDGSDQLDKIAARLQQEPTDRRCVLQMWDAFLDLGGIGKDYPCNIMATFQRGDNGELNLVVFNRSNDIIWGCYGANAVQFSFLLEYMALWIGCPIGTYSQVSVNWHAYDNDVWKQVIAIRPDHANYVDNPYADGRVHHVPMFGTAVYIDRLIKYLLREADEGFSSGSAAPQESAWAQMVWLVLKAHHMFKTLSLSPMKYTAALDCLAQGDQKADWIVASREWLQRRYDLRTKKEALLDGGLSHP